jgi:AraC-like DNA-binding protein
VQRRSAQLDRLNGLAKGSSLPNSANDGAGRAVRAAANFISISSREISMAASSCSRFHRSRGREGARPFCRERDRVAQRRTTTRRGHNAPNPICYLIDTDIVRASKHQHPVQGSGGKANLGRLGSVGARSKGIADHTFVSPDRRLDLGPLIVAAGFLPDHLAAISDHPQMAVALCRSGFSRRTRHRAGPRRHDNSGVRMTLRNSLADLILIVAAVGSEGNNWIGDLVEQSVSHRGIVGILPGHRDGDDLAAGGVNADMQLSPGSATGRSVLFDQPFAFSAEPQAVLSTSKRSGAIDVTLELLGAAFRAQRRSSAIAPRDQLFARISGYIEARLKDANLSPKKIAEDNGISVRYLYTLFSGQGMTVSGWVRRRRLLRCRAELDGADTGASITEIA